MLQASIAQHQPDTAALASFGAVSNTALSAVFFGRPTGHSGPSRLLKYPLRKRNATQGDFDFSDFLFAL